MNRLYVSAICMIIFGGWLNSASAQNVEFPDLNLANKVREALDLPPGAAIPKAQLATLTELDASLPEEAAAEEKISDLTGLEHATRLTALGLWNNQISDISPLAGLAELTFLDLEGNQIGDVTALAGLANLEELYLGSNQIGDINPLISLTNLTALSLSINQISDISSLIELTNLTTLYLWGNQISDISPLAGLAELTWLFLEGNQIGDVTALAGLVNLEELYLAGNPITDKAPLQTLLQANPYLQLDVDVPGPAWMPDRNLHDAIRVELGLTPEEPLTPQALQALTKLSATWDISDLTGLEHATRLTELALLDNQISDIRPLAGLTQLTNLNLRSNQISDISPLAGLTNLTSLDLGSARNGAQNQISDISPLAGLTQLTDLRLDRNQISDISPLAGLTNLTSLDLGNGLWEERNQISDIGPLAGLTQLTYLDLSSNQISDISSLASLTKLTTLDLGANQISDIGPLTGLTNLEILHLQGNPITDTSALHLILNQNPDLHVLTKDIDMEEISSVAFSPDGTRLASASSNGMVKLWDVATRETIATLEGHTDYVAEVAFSPDGALIASGSGDGTVKLWDVGRRETVATLEGHADYVTSVAFSPDGALIASGSGDGTVKLWNAARRETVATLEGHLERVGSVSFSPDGALLASGSDDGTVKLWDMAARETVATLEGEVYYVYAVSFSPDGALLSSTGASGIELWDMEAREIIATLEGESSYIYSVSFSPDGALLASAGTSGIELWDVEAREIIATLEGFAYNRFFGGTVNSVSFSSDGALLASGWRGGTVRFWNVAESARRLAKISGDEQQGGFGSELADPLVVEVRDRHNNPLQGVQVTFMVTAGDGRLGGESTVATATTDINGRAARTLTLGSGKTNTVEASIEHRSVTFNAVGSSPYQLASFEGASASFSPDGTLFASGVIDGTIKLWEVASQETVATLEGHTDSISSLSFSPDGALLASGSSDGTVKLWDLATRESIAALEGHTEGVVTAVSFSSDGGLLAKQLVTFEDASIFGGTDATVELWDVSNRETVATLEGKHASFSPDGNLLAFVSEGNLITLWDVGSRETIATLEGHTGAIGSVSFSPDGTLLASASFNDTVNTVKLWDVATGETFATLEGHVDRTFTLFSPDGNLLAYSSFDGMRLWDVSRQEPIAVFAGDVWSVTFSPDGTRLAYLENSESFPSELASTLNLLDMAQQKTVAAVGEHIGILASELGDSVWFSPDGNLLAYLSPDGIKLWDAAAAITPSEPDKIAADVNGDGAVNILDLVMVAANLGKTGQNIADVNGDDVVDIRDLVKVAGALGNAAAAPSSHPQLLESLAAADVKNWLAQAQRLNLTDAMSQRGIRFLERLLIALTPKETALLPNYPNPFNPETWIPYRLAKSADVTFTIYGVNGRVVRRLALGHQSAGSYQSKRRAAYWDGKNAADESVASGIYFYTLTAGDFAATRKMLIRK